MTALLRQNHVLPAAMWLLLPLLAAAQPPVATCHDPAFHKEVSRLLRFSIPTLDVDSLRVNYGRYTVLDAREWEEYAVSHLPGARYIGYKQFSERNLRGVPKDAPIVVYCSVGYRSEKIAERLRKLGYTRVYNVYGSIFEWVNRGYPVVDATGAEALSVHTYNRKWGRWLLTRNLQKVW